MGEALGARLAFAEAVISEVEKSTKLAVAKKDSGPGLMLAGLARLDDWLVAQTVKDDTSGLRLKVEDGAIWFQNTLVATPAGPPAESLKPVIEKAVEDIRGKQAWKALLAAAAKIKATARTLSNESAILKLSTVLPGDCRSCVRVSV